MEQFHEDIKQWVAVDTQLKLMNEQSKQLREQRSALAEGIHHHVEGHNLGKAIVNISDGKLRFGSTRHTSPLTLKYVNDCLHDCINNDEQVAQIMKVIKDSRTVNYVSDIKRTYNE